MAGLLLTQHSTVVPVRGQLQVRHEQDICIEYWDSSEYAEAANYGKCRKVVLANVMQACVFSDVAIPVALLGGGIEVCKTSTGPCSKSRVGATGVPDTDLLVLISSQKHPACQEVGGQTMVT